MNYESEQISLLFLPAGRNMDLITAYLFHGASERNNLLVGAKFKTTATEGAFFGGGGPI